MKNKIQHLLTKISLLLSDNNEKAWADTFILFNKRLDLDYDATLIEIRCSFGGAGSFNDLVLHRNGQMLVQENNELNVLQEQLYEVLKKEIISRRSH